MKIVKNELLPQSQSALLTSRLIKIIEGKKIIRNSNCSFFIFPCVFKQKKIFVAISPHEISDALKFFIFYHTRVEHNFMTTFPLTPQTELDLKNFFKSGSLQFPDCCLLEDDKGLQLPPEVLAFFLES